MEEISILLVPNSPAKLFINKTFISVNGGLIEHPELRLLNLMYVLHNKIMKKILVAKSDVLWDV